jgi:hypothetical protein
LNKRGTGKKEKKMMVNKAASQLNIPKIVEKIVENLGVDDLFTISKLGGMWYKIARHDAYERWKMCANSFENAYREAQAIREKQGKNSISWLEVLYEVESLEEWMDIQTEIQVSIMEKMLKNEMIVDYRWPRN